jgi:hypothetical protein
MIRGCFAKPKRVRSKESLGRAAVGHEWAKALSKVSLACETALPDTIRLYLIHVQYVRIAPKAMPPIYFHGNYNRYKEFNNTITH